MNFSVFIFYSVWVIPIYPSNDKQLIGNHWHMSCFALTQLLPKQLNIDIKWLFRSISKCRIGLSQCSRSSLFKTPKPWKIRGYKVGRTVIWMWLTFVAASDDFFQAGRGEPWIADRSRNIAKCALFVDRTGYQQILSATIRIAEVELLGDGSSEWSDETDMRLARHGLKAPDTDDTRQMYIFVDRARPPTKNSENRVL